MLNTGGSIFINYRRDDSSWNTVALYNELQGYFSRDQLFKDFNAIMPGDDFVESIRQALQDCDVLLVMIGKSWLTLKNAAGVRRLDEPDDFVRLEIAKALERKIKVIPVLFDDARMPAEDEVPPSIAALCRRQAIQVGSTRFEDDIRKLAAAIKHALNDPDRPGKNRNRTYTSTGQDKQANSSASPQFQTFTNNNTGNIPPKPNNNLVWGIITTIICCLPLGIASIIYASKVDTLYNQGKYQEAEVEANKARKWAVYSLVAAVAFWFIYFILIGIGAIPVPEKQYE